MPIRRALGSEGIVNVIKFLCTLSEKSLLTFWLKEKNMLIKQLISDHHADASVCHKGRNPHRRTSWKLVGRLVRN